MKDLIAYSVRRGEEKAEWWGVLCESHHISLKILLMSVQLALALDTFLHTHTSLEFTGESWVEFFIYLCVDYVIRSLQRSSDFYLVRSAQNSSPFFRNNSLRSRLARFRGR